MFAPGNGALLGRNPKIRSSRLAGNGYKPAVGTIHAVLTLETVITEDTFGKIFARILEINKGFYAFVMGKPWRELSEIRDTLDLKMLPGKIGGEVLSANYFSV